MSSFTVAKRRSIECVAHLIMGLPVSLLSLLLGGVA